jgi:6-phospho-beta-glucosidase
MLREEKEQAESPEGTRADQVAAVEKELFRAYSNPQLCEKPEALSKRGGSRYSEAAINLIDSIHNDRGDVQVVDAQNNGLIPQLPPDAVIETNCVIGKEGAAVLKDNTVPCEILGLIEQVKAYERFTIEAAVTGDRRKALIAFLNNPLVHDANDAQAALDEMLTENREYLPAFFEGGKTCC